MLVVLVVRDVCAGGAAAEPCLEEEEEAEEAREEAEDAEDAEEEVDCEWPDAMLRSGLGCRRLLVAAAAVAAVRGIAGGGASVMVGVVPPLPLPTPPLVVAVSTQAPDRREGLELEWDFEVPPPPPPTTTVPPATV